MPFVTEEIWKYLPNRGESALIMAKWAAADEAYFDDEAEQSMTKLIDIIRGIRNVRDEYNVEPGRKISAIISTGLRKMLFERYSYLFSRLCNVSSLELMAKGDSAPDNAASVVVGDVTAYLPLADFIDIAAECDRLTKEREKLVEQAEKSRKTLGNEQFIDRARPEIVEKERQRLTALEASIAQISDRLAGMCK
jgi:valyl-tRNA synthetase